MHVHTHYSLAKATPMHCKCARAFSVEIILKFELVPVLCSSLVSMHAQVIFRKLALEGSVAPHCPGYELPRYIKTAV